MMKANFSKTLKKILLILGRITARDKIRIQSFNVEQQAEDLLQNKEEGK